MTDAAIVVGAVIACAAGGLLPWLSAEVALVGAALLISPPGLPVLVLACAAAQVGAKSAVFGVARWAPERLPARARALPEWARRYGDRRRTSGALLLSAALVSVPPFYVVTVVAGLTGVPFALFALAGGVGTVARYAVLVWLAVRVVAA